MVIFQIKQKNNFFLFLNQSINQIVFKTPDSFLRTQNTYTIKTLYTQKNIKTHKWDGLGIYQPNQQTVDVQSDISSTAPGGGASSAQQNQQQQPQQNQEAFRLSGSDINKSFGSRNDAFSGSNFISSSSLALSGGGGNSNSKEAISSTANSLIGGGSNINTNASVGSGDSPTPTQHRRLAKSFSVAPSLSQTKGVRISFYIFAFKQNALHLFIFHKLI